MVKVSLRHDRTETSVVNREEGGGADGPPLRYLSVILIPRPRSKDELPPIDLKESVLTGRLVYPVLRPQVRRSRRGLGYFLPVKGSNLITPGLKFVGRKVILLGVCGLGNREVETRTNRVYTPIIVRPSPSPRPLSRV